MLFVWNKFSYDIEIKKIVSPQKRHQNKSGNIFNPIMLCVMLAVVLHGMLRDGVTTWMPSYISETYNLSSVISILTGVILPLFGIFSLHLASKLYTKKVSNPVMCAGIFFAIGAFSSVGLYLFTGSSALVSVVMFALLTGCMHGVNLVLICMVPAFFKKYGNVSTASGIINSCTYIGSAWSTYGIALLSETLGWNFTILSWLAIALCGTVLCFANSRAWHKKYQHNN